MDCFGTYFTHAQACDNVRVKSATQWPGSVHSLHMPKPVITFVFKVLRNGLLPYILYTCPNLWWRLCSKCYAMDCFGTYFTHAQACDNVRVKSATQWTASVHTLRMPKPVITFVFKVLRNGLLRYIYFTHVAICDNVPVGRTFEWFWVAAKICDPAAIRCCFTAIGDSTHVLKQTTYFFYSSALLFA